METTVMQSVQIILDNLGLFSMVTGGAAGGTFWLAKFVTDGQEKALKSRIELLAEEKRILATKVAELSKGTTEQNGLDHLVSRPTMRPGITFWQAIESAGLIDIEWRDKAATVAPPASFYELASSEVCIFGLSCRHTVFLESDLLKKLLQKAVDVHLVFLAPNSAGAQAAGQLLGFDLSAEIESVVNHANFKELQRFANFHVRVLDEDIPYTGVFLDADMQFKGEGKPRDPTGQLRLQPRTKYRGQHKGLVLQFRNVQGSSAYEYFAADARKIFNSAVNLASQETPPK